MDTGHVEVWQLCSWQASLPHPCGLCWVLTMPSLPGGFHEL